MMSGICYERLRSDVAGEAIAYRLAAELEPASGAGGKVFPPTYMMEGARDTKYALEKTSDGSLKSVLLDSVASQANRAELALLDALDNGYLTFPAPYVDFSNCDDVAFDRVSVLEAPHRIADAIFRDSTLDGVGFRLTETGKRIFKSSPINATEAFKYAPTSLLFGVWDSTGPQGGGGMKFQRAFVSEIIGHDPAIGLKVGSRIDPLGISASVKITAPKESDENMWELDPKGKGKPSDVNHSNVAPSIDAESGGVYIRRATQTAVLSLAALRKLRFPGFGKDAQVSARTALAALGLAALAFVADADRDLRSRCLLVPAARPEFKRISREWGQDAEAPLDANLAAKTLEEAVARCESDGIAWNRRELVLEPSQKLLDLIRESRKGGGGKE